MHHNLIISFPVRRADLRDLPSDFYDTLTSDEGNDLHDEVDDEFITVDFALTSACDHESGSFIAERFIEFMKMTPDQLQWSVDS